MRRKASALVCLLLAAALLSGSCLAALLTLPANGYVADLAGVLESGTVEHIVSQNQDLTNSTGAAIVVVTVDFLNGMDIDDYATELFNDWGIGDGEENNGVLILLAIGEDNYTILQGEGLQSALPTSTLGEYAGQYLDDDFVAGAYDAGVNKLFDGLYAWFEDYYAGTGSTAPGVIVEPDYQGQNSGGLENTVGSLVVFTICVVGAVLVFALIATALSRTHYGGVYYYAPYRPWPFFFGHRRRRYGPPPPPPPRPPSYRPHTGGGSSRGGGFTRSSGSARRSSGGFGGGSFRSSGRSGFGGGHSRGGGFRRK